MKLPAPASATAPCCNTPTATSVQCQQHLWSVKPKRTMNTTKLMLMVCSCCAHAVLMLCACCGCGAPQVGEQAVWQRMAAIECNCTIEAALDKCVARVQGQVGRGVWGVGCGE